MLFIVFLSKLILYISCFTNRFFKMKNLETEYKYEC